jgi:uncharacterized protein (TIGR03118 family)
MERSRLGPASVLTAVMATFVLLMTVAAPAGAHEGHGHGDGSGAFTRVNVVSDQPGVARRTDPNLVNAWGLAAGPTTPLWVADNGTSLSTIYPGVRPNDVMVAPLVVNTATDAPTGAVYNPTSGFKVGGQSALFIFDSESGDITGWAPNVPPPSPSTMAQPAAHGAPGAVFKGLALLATHHGTFLYAADFHNAQISVFDDLYQPVTMPSGAFHDARLPMGYAPFNVQALDGRLYVTYAKQDATAHDEVAGPGMGFVDVFNGQGRLLKRLVSHGLLNAPWGLTIAPEGFGSLGGDLLVGNFGDGRINVYDRHNGEFEGTLRGASGRPITIDGLWALRFGNGVTGTPRTLIFSAGPNDEAHGLMGFILPSQSHD